MITHITQSFMKDMRNYLEGNLCGNIMRERWQNGRLVDTTGDSAELGCYFEYYLTLKLTGTGTLPKDGKIPERKMTKSGVSEPYARAERNADTVIEYLRKMKIKVIWAGKKLTAGKYEGTIDLLCEFEEDITFHGGSTWKKGCRFIIDLKYSGMIDNKWDQWGWAGLLVDGAHIQKEFHKIQTRQYTFVTKSQYPFFYFVVDSSPKGEGNVLFVFMPVDEMDVEMHINEGNFLLERFRYLAETESLEPRPDISVCKSCPLNAECKDKHDFPHLKTIAL